MGQNVNSNLRQALSDLPRICLPTLHWLNVDEARRAAGDVPYRLLEEDPALSYGDPDA